MMLINMFKTYDVNVFFKRNWTKEAGHSNNFWWNVKQLPRVLKSSYSEIFWKISEKFSVTSSCSNVADTKPAILIQKLLTKVFLGMTIQ